MSIRAMITLTMRAPYFLFNFASDSKTFRSFVLLKPIFKGVSFSVAMLVELDGRSQIRSQASLIAAPCGWSKGNERR